LQQISIVDHDYGRAGEFRKMRVLIQDSDPDSCLHLQQILSFWGIKAHFAKTAEDVRELLPGHGESQTLYDLAIVDEKSLPEYQTTQLLGHQIPLVVLTSQVSGEEMGVWIPPSDCSCIVKPVSPANLYESLSELLRSHPQQGYAQLQGEADRNEPFNGLVLLAEDNLVNQEVAIGMLEIFGCRVDTVGNGQAAWLAATRCLYDLILMDCQMPVMDGYEVTRAIRQREQEEGLGRTPIVALTAHAMQGDREMCLGAGMDDYLSKPFTRESLENILRKWLPRKPAEATTEQVQITGTVSFPESSPGGAEPGEPGDAFREAPAARQEPPLDQKIINDIRALDAPGKPGLLARVAQAYFQETPSILEKLRDALDQGDANIVVKAAHTMKSSSANVGALHLADLFKQLETQARAQALEQAQDVFQQIAGEYGRVQQALNDELKGASPS